MANKAVELRQPVALRWLRIPFELRMGLWWCFWLLVLLFLRVLLVLLSSRLRIRLGILAARLALGHGRLRAMEGCRATARGIR